MFKVSESLRSLKLMAYPCIWTEHTEYKMVAKQSQRKLNTEYQFHFQFEQLHRKTSAPYDCQNDDVAIEILKYTRPQILWMNLPNSCTQHYRMHILSMGYDIHRFANVTTLRRGETIPEKKIKKREKKPSNRDWVQWIRTHK